MCPLQVSHQTPQNIFKPCLAYLGSLTRISWAKRGNFALLTLVLVFVCFCPLQSSEPRGSYLNDILKSFGISDPPPAYVTVKLTQLISTVVTFWVTPPSLSVRTHCAVFFQYCPAEMRRPIQSRQLIRPGKASILMQYEQILSFDPGEKSKNQLGYYKNFAMLWARANPRPLLPYKWGAFV